MPFYWGTERQMLTRRAIVVMAAVVACIVNGNDREIEDDVVKSESKRTSFTFPGDLKMYLNIRRSKQRLRYRNS